MRFVEWYKFGWKLVKRGWFSAFIQKKTKNAFHFKCWKKQMETKGHKSRTTFSINLGKKPLVPCKQQEASQANVLSVAKLLESAVRVDAAAAVHLLVVAAARHAKATVSGKTSNFFKFLKIFFNFFRFLG